MFLPSISRAGLHRRISFLSTERARGSPRRGLFGTALIFSALAAFFASTAIATAQLSLTQNDREIVVTSSAPPTWKIVLAVNPQATRSVPGGGTVRALYIPADSAESLVSTEPKDFCCAGWGLDNLEWRYVEKGKGVRAPLGTTATIDSLEIVERSPERIVVKLAGHWKNVPLFTRTIEFSPDGYRARIEADWDGPETFRGMWWLISLFRSSRVDNASVTIADADTDAVALPIAKENVFSLPAGIDFPYTVSFPLKKGPIPSLLLRVHTFAVNGAEGLRYELWPEEKGLSMFYPRWVNRKFLKSRYIFDYEWRIGDAGSGDVAEKP